MSETFAPSFDPDTQPEPSGGWSEEIREVENAIVVPASESAFVQQAGILGPSGEYCPHGALWRKFRPLTTMPEMPQGDVQKLSGRWLWGGVLWAHFGHFLVESTSRLWALDVAGGQFDGVAFIPKRPRVGEAVRGFQAEFINLLAPDLPIRVLSEPTQVQSLVVPGQGFGLGRISAGTARFRAAIHARFATGITPKGADRIYISRSKLGLGKGGLLGEEHLEDLLRAEGYDIFHPQEFSLSEQIARYKAASHVIAADGSAIHLYAMVGRADQALAIILRRASGANNLLAVNATHFCGRAPLMVEGLRSEWARDENAKKSNRQTFGELDHGAIAAQLQGGGFISRQAKWSALSDDARQQIFTRKGLTGENAVTELRQYVRARKRAARAAAR